MRNRTALDILAVIFIAATVLAAWYRIDGQPLPEAAAFLVGDGYAAQVEQDGGAGFLARPAEISQAQQIDFANERTAAFSVSTI
jgi:hypothetical protein